MIDSYGILPFQCIASPGFVVSLLWRILSNVFATQDVRLTGLYEDMHPGGFPAFSRGRMMAIFQIWGAFPVEKLRLKMPSSSCLALGPRALKNVIVVAAAAADVPCHL